MNLFKRLYGANPLQLAALLGCFALAGYAVLQAKDGPLPLRMAEWFVGAAIAHDLVLFPLYAIADRSFGELLSRGPRRVQRPAAGLNHVRVPALFSGLLFVVFYPNILARSNDTFGRAAGLDQDGYFAKWLLVTAILFGLSAVLFAVRLALRGRRQPPADPTSRPLPGDAGGPATTPDAAVS